uniref:Uncharacterized protein n=1 Tax=Rhizophora mucronata TaxID=61149 RepID=A0A2P2LYK7_RHIMU
MPPVLPLKTFEIKFGQNLQILEFT